MEIFLRVFFSFALSYLIGKFWAVEMKKKSNYRQIGFMFGELSLVRNEVSAKIYPDVAERCVPPFRIRPSESRSAGPQNLRAEWFVNLSEPGLGECGSRDD